jgi:hypothetical protein
MLALGDQDIAQNLLLLDKGEDSTILSQVARVPLSHRLRKIGPHEWVFGLSPTLTFGLIESIWGARYLMRTPMDLQGVASRDTGIAVRGPIGDSQFSYRLMGGTGAEFGAEAGDGRKWMAALNWTSRTGI